MADPKGVKVTYRSVSVRSGPRRDSSGRKVSMVKRLDALHAFQQRRLHHGQDARGRPQAK